MCVLSLLWVPLNAQLTRITSVFINITKLPIMHVRAPTNMYDAVPSPEA